MRRFILSMVALLVAVVPVWAEQGQANIPRAKGLPMQIHGDSSPAIRNPGDDPGLASVLKKLKLSDFPSKTIGEAFDSYRYFTKREWKETRSSRGKIYVDFTGWLKKDLLDISAIKNGISSRAVGIKFLVEPDGRYRAVMASRIENKTDGMLYSEPIEDLNGILKKIYANKEIRF